MSHIEVRGMAPLLAVWDMPTAVAFYRDLLGFEVVQTSKPDAVGDDFGWCLLRLNGVEVMLNTAYDDGERPAAPDLARLAAHRDTILYFGCPDVDGAYDYLSSRGLGVNPPEVAYYGIKQLYLTDPDGYSLCFQWPAETTS